MLDKIKNNQQLPFWLFTFSALIGLTLPSLIKDGMFMDAMLYTCVSHNLSMGIGTFWFPQFSVHNVAGLSSFHEQPPLVFGIQSLFFKVLGDSMYVERFYTFLTMCITTMLIIFLWKDIFKNQNSLKKISWLPVILWITIPVCFWSYSNNMHENTMGIFTLCSVLLSYKAFRSDKFSIILLILSGVFIFLASLSKGLPGFFPISIPLLYYLTTQKSSFSKAIIQSIIITRIPFLIYLILYLIPESNESLSIYFFKRVIHRINQAPTVDNRFAILGRLFMELIPQMLLVLIFLFVAKIKKIEFFISEHLKIVIFFITIGLSASVPLMLTMVQKGFYFVPALPFFSIGLSICIAPLIVRLTEHLFINHKKYLLSSLFCLLLFLGVFVFSFMQIGKVGRNKEMLHDVYLIGTVVPKYSTISMPKVMWNQWDLQCYLIRYFNISLDIGDKNNYFILERNMKADTLSEFKKVDIATLQYDIYNRQ